MKKSFFKKLSFVVALAMTVSTVAPAAGAFAAETVKLNSAKKYLHLGVEDLEDFNFNIDSTKGKGWNYLWESSDEDVAVVDENNGVTTAAGVGTATITVFITDKDGEEVGDASATVVVRDNIADVKIENNPTDKKLAVGVPFNYNIDFTTRSGSTTATSSVTRWTVTPEGATIADNGVLTATKAGEYTVTAVSFQSKDKYNTWNAKAGKALTDALVLDYDQTTVTVAPTMKDVKQVNSTKATVIFDADMSKVVTKDNLKVSRVITGGNVSQEVPMLVKEVKFNADGTEATVEMFVAFVGGENYKFAYGTMNDGFVAAKNDAKEVASVELGVKEMVWKDGAKTLTAVLKNKDGVDITAGIDSSRVTYKLEGTEGYLTGDKLVLFKTGQVATVRVIFHTYTYDSNYKEITIEGVFNVIATDAASYDLGGAAEWTFKTTAPTKDDWGKALTKTLAAGDEGYRVYTRVKSTETANTKYYYSYSDASLDNAVTGGKAFTFSSSNSDVLYVDAQGYVYPIKAGDAVIICYYDGKARDTFAVKVEEARKVVGVSIKDNKSVVSLTNSPSVAETAALTIVLKDQLGADFNDATPGRVYDNSKMEVKTLLSSPQATSTTPVVNPLSFTNDGTNLTINLTGTGATKGTWSYLITAYGVSTVLTVTVNEPSNATIAYYALTVDKASIDTAVAKDAAVKTANVTLLGYADNGVANFKAVWGTNGYTYTLKDPSGNPVTAAAALDGSIEVAAAGATVASPASAVSGPAITSVSGTGITKIAKGTYYLTALKGTDVVAYSNFTVVDTTAAATFELKALESTSTSVLQAVRDAIDVSLAGTKIADADLFNVVYAQGATLVTDSANDDVTAKGTLYIKSVDFITSFTDKNAGGATFYVKYTVNVDRNITIK